MLRIERVLMTLAVGILLSVSAPAQQTPKVPPKPSAKNPTVNHQVPRGSQNGAWAQEKGNCQALNAKAKDMLAQEKQLHEQGQAKEQEEKSLVAQAQQIESERVALEHQLGRGQKIPQLEAEIKAKEQQRVALEHQAQEKSQERLQLERQANEMEKEQHNVELQHKQECNPHAASTPH